MSPDDPKYLPSDGPVPHDPNVRQTPAERYDAWDRGDEIKAGGDEGADGGPQSFRLPPAPSSESMFAFLEIPYSQRPRFPASVGWAIVYFAVALMVVIFFWIFAQVAPAVIALVGLIVWNLATGKGLGGLQEESMAPTLIAGHLVAISLVLVFLRVILGPDWLRRMAIRLPSLWHFLLTVLLVPALLLLASWWFAQAKRYLPSLGDLLGLKNLPGMEEMVKVFGTWPWWLGVLVVGLGPALSEELWCRGLLGLGLFGRNGVKSRLWVSAFYFGLLHVDPQQGSMAAHLGLVLYFVLLTTRCFWMPVLIHFSINSTSVIAARFESASAIDQRPEDIPLLVYAGAFILFWTIAISLVRTRARLVNTDTDGLSSWEPVYAGLEHPPAHSGVVVRRPRPDLIDLCLVALGVGSFVAALSWTVVFG